MRVKSKAWMSLKCLTKVPLERKRFAFLRISAAEIVKGSIRVDFFTKCRFTIILVWSLVDFEEVCDKFSLCALWKPWFRALNQQNLIKCSWIARFLCRIVKFWLKFKGVSIENEIDRLILSWDDNLCCYSNTATVCCRILGDSSCKSASLRLSSFFLWIWLNSFRFLSQI